MIFFHTNAFVSIPIIKQTAILSRKSKITQNQTETNVTFAYEYGIREI